MATETWSEGAKSKLAGKTVKIVKGTYAGSEYRLQDWAATAMGMRWADNLAIACINYGGRVFQEKLPFIGEEGEDDVYYGHIGSLGYLVHASEIDPAAYEE